MALNTIISVNNKTSLKQPTDFQFETNQPMMTCHILQTGLGVVVGRVVGAAGGHPGVAADHPPIARTRKDDER